MNAPQPPFYLCDSRRQKHEYRYETVEDFGPDLEFLNCPKNDLGFVGKKENVLIFDRCFRRVHLVIYMYEVQSASLMHEHALEEDKDDIERLKSKFGWEPCEDILDDAR